MNDAITTDIGPGAVAASMQRALSRLGISLDAVQCWAPAPGDHPHTLRLQGDIELLWAITEILQRVADDIDRAFPGVGPEAPADESPVEPRKPVTATDIAEGVTNAMADFTAGLADILRGLFVAPVLQSDILDEQSPSSAKLIRTLEDQFPDTPVITIDTAAIAADARQAVLYELLKATEETYAHFTSNMMDVRLNTAKNCEVLYGSILVEVITRMDPTKKPGLGLAGEMETAP